jgi:hypothetical protein
VKNDKSEERSKRGLMAGKSAGGGKGKVKNGKKEDRGKKGVGAGKGKKKTK